MVKMGVKSKEIDKKVKRNHRYIDTVQYIVKVSISNLGTKHHIVQKIEYLLPTL